jgi:hypothetical protein
MISWARCHTVTSFPSRFAYSSALIQELLRVRADIKRDEEERSLQGKDR